MPGRVAAIPVRRPSSPGYSGQARACGLPARDASSLTLAQHPFPSVQVSQARYDAPHGASGVLDLLFPYAPLLLEKSNDLPQSRHGQAKRFHVTSTPPSERTTPATNSQRLRAFASTL